MTFVYRLYAMDGRLLYVGLSKKPQQRLQQHAISQKWWGEVVRHELQGFPTRTEARSAELAAISTERPLFNRAGRDGATPSRADFRESEPSFDDTVVQRALGQAVRIFRMRRSWRQQDLAAAAGLPRSYIGMIERGDTDPGGTMQWRLAKALGASMPELWKLAEDEFEALTRIAAEAV